MILILNVVALVIFFIWAIGFAAFGAGGVFHILLLLIAFSLLPNIIQVAKRNHFYNL